MKTTIKSTLATAAFVLAASLAPVSASADGTATYSMAQSGNTVSIYENSGAEAVNTVQLNLGYSGAQPVSVATGGTFTTCFGPTTTNIPCSALGGNITGSNLVATVTFANATAASHVSVLTSSAIYDSTTNADVLNHAALAGLDYSYTVSSGSTGGSGGSGSGSGSGSTGSTGSSSSNGSTNSGNTAGSTKNASSNNSKSTSGTVAGASTSKDAKHSQAPAKKIAHARNTAAAIPAAHTGRNIAAIVVILLAAAAAAYWRFSGRKLDFAFVKALKK